jgi:hypothetical protein
MKGLFGLNNFADLFKKLEREFEQLVAEPTDAYLAYNFFVTAWHLLEWKHPGLSGKPIRDKIRDQTPLLQICEHLAVGAKHFEPTNPKLKAVSASKKSNGWTNNAWAADAWTEGAWTSSLVIELTGDAQKAYGTHIKVEDLAHFVMEYWRSLL